MVAVAEQTVENASVGVIDSKKEAVVKKDEEKIFSIRLIPPLLIAAGYVWFLYKTEQEMKAQFAAGEEPVRESWFSLPIGFTIAYLAMVFFGTKLMKGREEFKIKPYIFVYNLYQCIMNIWTVVSIIQEVSTNPIFTGVLGNRPTRGPATFRISFLVWAHYNNKFVELLDTVWMVLRNKNKQISFLHCYHHVLLIWAWFLVVRTESTGDTYFGGTVNSFIHIIMYGYYTLTLLNIPCPWKKWITTAQMIQFVLCFIQATYDHYLGYYPFYFPLAQEFVMFNMLILFGNFYMKSYGDKKGKGGKAVVEDKKEK